MDTAQATRWHGQMFSAEENDYVDVSVMLILPDTLVVYEFSDTGISNEVLRLLRE